jgi:hypothetical protein
VIDISVSALKFSRQSMLDPWLVSRRGLGGLCIGVSEKHRVLRREVTGDCRKFIMRAS